MPPPVVTVFFSASDISLARSPLPHHIFPVNRRKKFPIVALALLATSSIGFGQLSLSLWTDATYRQKSAGLSDFRGVGDFGVLLRDGNVVINPGCAFNGSLTYFGANPPFGCPIGATVYVSIGDINPAGPTPPYLRTPPATGDPSLIYDAGAIGPLRVFRPDDMTYWEVPTAPTPAVAISPSYPQYCHLYAAPPSGLARPINTFADETLTVYGNLQSASVRGYSLARYRYALTFDSANYTDGPSAGADLKSTIVPGEYDFLFPQLTNPKVAVTIPVFYRPIPEGYNKVGTIMPGKISQGFRFTKLNGSALTWSADGYVQLDPRLPNTFEWEGNGTELMFPSTDVMYFAIVDLGGTEAAGTLPGSPDREIPNPAAPGTEATLFPGFTAPGISRILLQSPLDKSYTIPPRVMKMVFVDPVTHQHYKGYEGLLQVTLERATPTSSVATDYSQRRYQMPVRFADTYAGWASVSFPPGTPASSRLASADPDHDGFTNYQEWLAGTDPMVSTSHPAPPHITFVQGRAVRSTATAIPGHWETSINKANVVPPVTYEYEFSNDMQNWRSIGDNDPDWLLINDADPAGKITVQSRADKLVGPGFLRVKMSQEADPTPLSTQ